MSQVNYKQKYFELKQKYMDSVDTAFRLGYEQGANETQMQQAQDQQAAEQEAAMGQEQGGQDPMGGDPAQEEAPADSAHPGGSELDQHIEKLESMLGKSEDMEIRTTVQKLIEMRKAEKLSSDLKKSDQAVKSIAKSLKAPFKLGKQAEANMTSVAKTAVTMQEKIVTDIMKSWESEEKHATNDITAILNRENLTRK